MNGSSRTPPSAAFVFAALLLAPGCAPDERLAPLEPPPDAEPPADAEPPPPPTRVKRTLVERSPYGNVAERENLLWDGDFEWASPFADQYGWFEPPANPTISDVVVGAACRSGVKCARLAKNRSLVGIGVGAAEVDLRASVWVRFEPDAALPVPACAELSAFLFSTGELYEPDPELDLSPTSDTPDEAGWCQLTVVSPPRRNKVYLLVRNRSGVPVLVDDAVVARSDGSVQFSAPSRGPSALDPAARVFLDEAKRAALELARPIEGRPNPAREAFERHKRGVLR